MIVQPEKGTRNVNDSFYEAQNNGLTCLIVNSFIMWNLLKRRMMCLSGCADGMSGRSMRLCQRLGKWRDRMMGRELFAKLFEDEYFKNFCGMVDELRNKEHKIKLPLETAILLYAANVDCVKDNDDMAAIHNLVKIFLDPDGRGISKTTSFYDYFVITNIMWIVDGKREQLEGNRWRQLPLDLTEYANSICKFNTCTCGLKPNIVLSCFCNSLTGKVSCEKCGLSVNMLFTHEADFFHGDSGTVYVNLEDGIKRLSDLWNEEVAKNESILHRTMRELLSYGSNVCVNPVIYDLHKKLYSYMTENNIYRKPEYWNEPGYWDAATDKMMECKEPVQWVEEYLWENMPCKIGA